MQVTRSVTSGVLPAMLKDAQIKSAKPKDKRYRLYDKDGLFIDVTPAGTKTFRMRVQKNGKDSAVTLGKYPLMSLAEARLARNDILKKIANGEDLKQTQKKTQTFREVAEEWIEKNQDNWRQRYIESIKQKLEHDPYVLFGDMPINMVTSKHILLMMQEMERRNSVATAKKVLGHVRQVFTYAKGSLKIDFDPSAGLMASSILKKIKHNHFAAATTKEDAQLVIRSVRSYPGSLVVKLALEFLMLTFVRPGNVRAARWEDIDLKGKVWTIPADQMKMHREHKVPLSRQPLAVLDQASIFKQLNQEGLIFPALRKTKTGMISDATFGVALRAMGIPQDMMSAHGFRSMASSLLNEAGHYPDVIEKQLAHAGSDHIREIYNRTEYWDERVKLMQAWADLVDKLEQGNEPEEDEKETALPSLS